MNAIVNPADVTSRLSARVLTHDLKAALTQLVKVAHHRNTPIISCVHVRNMGANALVMTAHDLDTELTMSVQADVSAPGAIVVNAKQMLAFVKGASETFITIENDETHARLRAGDDASAIPTLPVSGFPLFDARDVAQSFTMPCDDMRLLIEKTAFAVSSEETRYYLNGIYFHTRECYLRSVATDGHRLAWRDVALPESAAEMPGVVIPIAALPLIEKLCVKSGTVAIDAAHMQLTFTCGRTQLRTRTIDGTFPDYARVIPSTSSESFEVDRKAFAAKIKLMLGGAKDRGVLKLDIHESLLRLSKNDADEGEKTASIPCDATLNAQIGFNARYLLSILDTIDAPRVRLDYAEATKLGVVSPCILRASGGASHGRDERQGAVIMPRRV